jgi:hypothetical protein
MLKAAQVVMTPPLRRVGYLLNRYDVNKNGDTKGLPPDQERRFIREYLRIDIYLTLQHVLKNMAQVPLGVQRVHDIAEHKCCNLLRVSPALLKTELKEKLLRQLRGETPGTIGDPFLGPGGQRRVDIDNKAFYLTKAARQKYVLTFQDGLIYQFKWWGDEGPWGAHLVGYEDETPPKLELVRANSFYAIERQAVDLWTNPNVDSAFRGDEPARTREQFREEARTKHSAPFVVGFNRKFYMTQQQDHSKRWGGRGFFHSCYFCGEPVLFAGGIVIDDGKVKMVDCGSGHYIPQNKHLVSCLEALRMYGVNLLRVKVKPYGGHEQPALDFLRHRPGVARPPVRPQL